MMFAAALAFQAIAQDRRVEANTVNAVNANWPFKFGGPYYSHIFIDKIYKDSDVVIPCQSVFDVQIAARHADPRTTMRYDRARKNLDRHPNYILAAYMASGT